MPHKPKPGVCGRCGQAVMRSPRLPPRTGELNGHFYLDGELHHVRCSDHGGARFEASPGSLEYQGDIDHGCRVC